MNQFLDAMHVHPPSRSSARDNHTNSVTKVSGTLNSLCLSLSDA